MSPTMMSWCEVMRRVLANPPKKRGEACSHLRSSHHGHRAVDVDVGIGEDADEGFGVSPVPSLLELDSAFSDTSFVHRLGLKVRCRAPEGAEGSEQGQSRGLPARIPRELAAANT